MRSVLVTVLALTLGSCKSEEKTAPADAAEAAAAKAPEGKADLTELETAFSEIVQTKRANDNPKRRDQCIALEPKVADLQKTHATDNKLQEFASKLTEFCPEAIESRKLMIKAAEPEPVMPELSATMKSMFTADSLKGDLKKAKAIAKKKGDPEDVCKKIGLTLRVVNEKKGKRDKKTKKVIKEAGTFCSGPAPVMTVQYHLRAAAQAEKNDKPADLSAHCTAALSKLVHVKAQKPRNQLEQSVKGLCREAYALKPMLDSRGS
jgi:hypothetical protein